MEGLSWSRVEARRDPINEAFEVPHGGLGNEIDRQGGCFCY